MDYQKYKKHFVPCVLREVLFEPIPTYWLFRKDRVPERVRMFVTPRNHHTLYVGEYGHIYIATHGRLIELHRMKSEYNGTTQSHLMGNIYRINAHRRDGVKTINEYFCIHYLVALCWCPNPDPVHRTQVDHLDNNRHNNVATNLQWVTPAENYRRYYFNYNMLKLASKLNTLRKVIY